MYMNPPDSVLTLSRIRRFRKKPEVAWKRGLRALRSSCHLAVNINCINNHPRKSFKMEQVLNIEDVKLTPEDIPGALFRFRNLQVNSKPVKILVKV